MQDYSEENDLAHGANGLTQFVIGAVVGAGLALLLAPAEGRETRRRVGTTMKRWGEGARSALKRTRGTLDEFKDAARSAIDTGREEYMRSRRPEEQPGTRPPPSPTV